LELKFEVFVSGIIQQKRTCHPPAEA
jgi:hypothetical protein